MLICVTFWITGPLYTERTSHGWNGTWDKYDRNFVKDWRPKQNGKTRSKFLDNSYLLSISVTLVWYNAEEIFWLNNYNIFYLKISLSGFRASVLGMEQQPRKRLTGILAQGLKPGNHSSGGEENNLLFPQTCLAEIPADRKIQKTHMWIELFVSSIKWALSL